MCQSQVGLQHPVKQTVLMVELLTPLVHVFLALLNEVIDWLPRTPFEVLMVLWLQDGMTSS
jgi:hypothetical protein